MLTLLKLYSKFMLSPSFSTTQTSISQVLTEVRNLFCSKNTQWIKTFYLRCLDNIAWIASALSWPYRTTLSTSLIYVKILCWIACAEQHYFEIALSNTSTSDQLDRFGCQLVNRLYVLRMRSSIIFLDTLAMLTGRNCVRWLSMLDYLR